MNQSTDNQSSESESAGTTATVAETLRDARIKTGQDVLAVAQRLRISARYLEAIEEGRLEDLPGMPYAVGFVRSYAEYLSLDEDEIVRRFKLEASGLSPTSELVFPKPIPEGGVPGGSVLLVGAAVALLAYGIWYLNTESSDQLVERVAPIPERLADEVADKSASPQEGEAISAETVIARSETQPEPEAQSAVEAVEQPAEQIAEAVVEEVVETPAVEPTVETATEPVNETSQVPAVAPEAIVEAEVVEAVVAKPVPTPEAAETSSRITVRAKSNSWIQIRDEVEDKLLFTRLLRKGDEYSVPDRADLILLTGNAGALEILVDGEVVPSIGDVGDVRRNVALDPARLKSGNAVSN